MRLDDEEAVRSSNLFFCRQNESVSQIFSRRRIDATARENAPGDRDDSIGHSNVSGSFPAETFVDESRRIASSSCDRSHPIGHSRFSSPVANAKTGERRRRRADHSEIVSRISFPQIVFRLQTTFGRSAVVFSPADRVAQSGFLHENRSNELLRSAQIDRIGTGSEGVHQIDRLAVPSATAVAASVAEINSNADTFRGQNDEFDGSARRSGIPTSTHQTAPTVDQTFGFDEFTGDEISGLRPIDFERRRRPGKERPFFV